MSQTPRQNPFVGLRPFESEDSLYYFGRDEQIKALLRQLHETRFLAVVGSSGSGKSSLIRAGLIPHLEAGFLVQDRDLWRIAKMKPGDAPLDNFAQALRAAVKIDRSLVNEIDRSLKFAENLANRESKRPVNGLDDLAALLRRQGAKAALDFLRPALAEADANLLLLVDQFEEIFRYSMNTDDRRRQEEARSFVALLLRLAEQTEWPVFVCLTMRSDFLGDCDVFHGLPEAMNRSQYLVPRLTRSQRREAIANPIRLTGGQISPRLLDRLLNENVDTRDDLPVLQHAMMRTWAEWAKTPNGAIDLPHYEKIGAIQDALNQHANEALAELTEAQQATAKILFQTITETDAGNRRIRRPCHLSEIAAISGAAPEALLEIIQKFVKPSAEYRSAVFPRLSGADKMSALQNIQEDGRSFLVLSSENPADDPLVDISHESLIRQWETLRAWVDEEAESAKTYRRLAESAELYQQGKAGLYREADLQVALEWQEKQKPTVAWAKRYAGDLHLALRFLEDSKNFAEAEREILEKQRLERERLLREKAELVEKEARQQRAALRRTRVFATALIVLLLLALAAAWRALERGKAAEHQTLAANYNLARAFEEKARNTVDDAAQSGKAELYRQAWIYAAAALQQQTEPESLAMTPAPAGTLFDPSVIYNSFAEKWFSPAVSFHRGAVNSVAFSPDGKMLASASWDETIRLWEVASGESRRELKGHANRVRSVAFSPDGKMLASASNDQTIRLWDVASGESRRELKGHTHWVTSVAFSPDGKMLASGSSDNTIRLWYMASGESRRELKGHTNLVLSVAFSPDGKMLASGSYDNTIRLWDVASGESRRELKGHTNSVWSVAFSPDGKMLASASDDQTIRLWDVASGKSRRELKGHSNYFKSVAFSPDGKILASASYDQTIRLWDVSFDQLYYAYGKNWTLWQNFSEAIQFLWGLKLVNLEIQPAPRVPTLYNQDGYHFVYDQKFRPLLNPPMPGQTKFEQIFDWAKQQTPE